MAKLYDGCETPQENLYAFACDELGKVTADYCVAIASVDDFGEFARTCENLGEELVTGGSGPRYKPAPGRAHDANKVLNAILLMRYPFLAGFGAECRFGSKSGDEEHANRYENDGRFFSTELDSLLDGWRSRFGIALCEDIRTVLESAEKPESAFVNYRVDQVKEKYATLRWYDGGYPMDVADPMSDLNYVYEALSEVTCDVCGSWLDVRQDKGGYIASECMRCRCSSVTDADRPMYGAEPTKLEKRVLEVAKKHGYESERTYVPGRIRDAVVRADIAEDTVGLSGMLADSVVIKSYGAEGDVSYNAYERLRLGYPGLNVVKMVERHDLYVQLHPALDAERASDAIDDAIAEDKREREEFARKYGR